MMEQGRNAARPNVAGGLHLVPPPAPPLRSIAELSGPKGRPIRGSARCCAMAAPAAAPDEVRPLHSAALRFCPAPSSSPFYWITPEQRAGASTCIGPTHQRIGGTAAPLAPAAVVHADL